MKNYFIIYCFLFFLSIGFVFTNLAQEQPVQQTEPNQEELITYKVSEIPIKLEETSSFISDLYDNVLKPDEVKNIETELNEILKNYSLIKAQTDSIKLEE